jgi:hypothetical protein
MRRIMRRCLRKKSSHSQPKQNVKFSQHFIIRKSIAQ